jgi:hypothetical protein
MLGFNFFVVLGVNDRHSGGAAEDLGKHALTPRRQMRHDDKRKAIARRN